MLGKGSLKKSIRTNLMIAIPLLTTILVFGALIYVDYIIKLYFVRLVNDEDVLLFNQVVAILQRQIWIFSGAAGAIGWVLAYAITFPIKRLTETARGVATGDLTKSVRVDSEDEIGMLGQSFNSMVSSLNEQIIESMRGAVITINMNGIIVTFNKSAEIILGYSSEEMVGKSVFDVFDRQGGNRQLREIIEGTLTQQRTRASQAIAITARDGRTVKIDITTALLRDKKNTFLGIVVTFKDLEQVRQMEEQIRRTDRLAAVGSLAAGVAHEIRNPLGSIKGLVQLLQEDLPGADKKFAYTEVIVKEVDRLNKVVEELLDFARPEQPETAEGESVCVNSVIEQTAQLVEHDSLHAHVRIARLLPAGLPPVRGSAKKLQQAFLNIILNAINAMPQGGTLTIETAYAATQGEVQVRFRDTGKGIPLDVLPKIFDPFFTTKNSGSGLGLTVTHHIISALHGKIDVRSGPEGTVFTLNFPAQPQREQV
ncbi:MAG: ATP-binding protein [Candidatus Omnitrophica bacterium]|nr:ATP-binding protein [Candidatus Omnitrophota bacterium]